MAMRMLLLSVIILSVVVASICVLCLEEGVGATDQPISADEILKLLPKDSRIADIPVSATKNPGNPLKPWSTLYVNGISTADINGDGMAEVVVAYYTPPHQPFVDKDGNETGHIDDESRSDLREQLDFYRRAHVAVLDNVNGNWEIVWDSGGWGMAFSCARTPEDSGDNEDTLKYPKSIFMTADLDGDDSQEIVFSRSSFGSEGSIVQIWGWKKGEFVKMLETKGQVSFLAMGSDKCRIRSVDYHAGEYQKSEYIYDKDKMRFVPSKADAHED